MPLFSRRPSEPLLLAGRQRRHGDPHAAIETLAEILTRDAADVGANLEMARCLRLIGDPKGAEDHLRAALEITLDYTLVLELAETLAEQDRAADAEEMIDAAIFMAQKTPRLDPGAPLLIRATIAHAQGRDEDAIAICDQITGDRLIRKRSSRETLNYAKRLREGIQA